MRIRDDTVGNLWTAAGVCDDLACGRGAAWIKLSAPMLNVERTAALWPEERAQCCKKCLNPRRGKDNRLVIPVIFTLIST